MEREIYEVYAKVVDANGTYSTLSGYPKSFDSRTYNNDTEKARRRAEGEFSATWGAMCLRDDRKLQIVWLLRATDGLVMDYRSYGSLYEPDPASEPETTE